MRPSLSSDALRFDLMGVGNDDDESLVPTSFGDVNDGK
jgi:hypothetical protein